MRPRDTGRARVYAAQGAAGAACGADISKPTIPNDALQAEADAILGRRAVRSRWPDAKVSAQLKRGGSALGYRESDTPSGRITLPLFARNPWIVCHEVAHVLTPGGYAPHGPEFRGVYLHLVGSHIGRPAAKALRAEFKARRLTVSLKAVPAPQDVPSLAEEAAERAAYRRAAAALPVTSREALQAASVLRRAATEGLFGTVGRKPRDHALATARAIDRAYETKAAPR